MRCQDHPARATVEVSGSLFMLWVCLALLTAAVVLVIGRPLTRPAASDVNADVRDAGMAVYRDQLAELENDRERGLIGHEETAAARVEIARRLLHMSNMPSNEHAAPGANEPKSARIARARAVQFLLAAMPAAGLALYLFLGSPGLPGQPLSTRQSAPVADSPLTELVARVEAELKRNPEDPRGWSVIAPVYIKMQRYDDAAYAFSQVLRLKGEAVEPLLGFAQASLLANNGIVNEGVKRAANRVLALEPGSIEPQVWLALANEQDGDIAGALAGYTALLASAQPGAPWVDAVKQQVAILEGRATPERGANQAAVKPSADAIAALPPDEQQKQIAAMVSGLAERLKQNGDDLPGWLRLVRAYQVMGRKDEAVAALGSARKQFASDGTAISQIDALARELGL